MATQRTDVRISVPMEAVVELCRRQGIRELALFGSVLRDDFADQSDVDMLVEFEDEFRHSMFSFFGIEQELTGLIGRQVDLVEKGALHPIIKDEVLASRRIVYVAA